MVKPKKPVSIEQMDAWLNEADQRAAAAAREENNLRAEVDRLDKLTEPLIAARDKARAELLVVSECAARLASQARPPEPPLLFRESELGPRRELRTDIDHASHRQAGTLRHVVLSAIAAYPWSTTRQLAIRIWQTVENPLAGDNYTAKQDVSKVVSPAKSEGMVITEGKGEGTTFCITELGRASLVSMAASHRKPHKRKSRRRKQALPIPDPLFKQ